MALKIHSPTHDTASVTQLYARRSGVIRKAAGRARAGRSLDYVESASALKSPYKTTRMAAWMQGIKG